MANEASSPSSLPALLNRTGQLIDILRSEIRARHLQAGERLPTEQELVARFKVRRRVVRDAIACLRAEGLVITRRGVGAFVADGAATRPLRVVSDELRSLHEVLNVMQFRLAVEMEAAGIAAENRNTLALHALGRALDAIDEKVRAGGFAVDEDFAFHFAIAAATGNPQFERVMRFLGAVIIPRQTLRLGTDDPAERRRYLGRIQMEHRAIYAAIRDADAAQARRAMRQHLEYARDRYKAMADGRT